MLFIALRFSMFSLRLQPSSQLCSLSLFIHQSYWVDIFPLLLPGSRSLNRFVLCLCCPVSQKSRDRKMVTKTNMDKMDGVVHVVVVTLQK